MNTIEDRVSFGGYSKKQIDALLTSFVIEDESSEPPILTLNDVIVSPNALFFRDLEGRIIPETMRTFFPADLIPETQLANLIRKHTNQAPEQIAIKNYDIVDTPVYFAGIFMSHYGHFVLDALSRLWALDRFADHQILYTSFTRDPPEDHPVARTILTHIGLDLSCRLSVAAPTLFRTMICPIPTIQYGHRAYHQHAKLAERVTAALGIAADDETGRIYLSRSQLAFSSRALSETELETRLERYGYRMVHPERLPLEQQIRLFSGARTIVGTRGSAFHTTLFAPEGSRSTLVPIGWQYLDGHYILVDGIKDHRSIYINGADIAPAPDKKTYCVTLHVERTLDLMHDHGLL